MEILFFVVVAISGLAYIYIAWRERHLARTPIGFFQAGRNMGPVTLSGTYIATSLALANAMFYFLWLGYNIGLVGLWIQLAWCLGFVVLFKLLPKILKESGTKTFHEYIEVNFGKFTARMAAFISFLGIGLNFGYEILVGSTISNSIWGMEPYNVFGFALLIVIIVIMYSLIGGFSAILRTDSFQWVASSLALILSLLAMRQYIASQPQEALQSYNEISQQLMNPFNFKNLAMIGGWIALLSNIAFSFPWQICDMTSWQKLSSCDPKSKDNIRWGIIFSGIYLFFIPGFVTLLLGIYLRAYSGAENSLLGSLITISYDYPPITVLMLIGFLSALISTADTFLIGSTQAFVLDIWKTKRVEKSSDGIRIPQETVGAAKRYLPIIALFFLLVTFFIWQSQGFDNDALFNLIYLVYSTQLSLVWVMLFSLTGRKKFVTSESGILSIFLGVLSNAVFFYIGVNGHWDNGINFMPIGCLIFSLLGAFVGILFNKKQA